MTRKLYSILVLFLALSGCSVNPVTGEREFSLVSAEQEIEIGKENYPYMQQSGGGEYDIDPELTRYVQSVGDKLAAVSDRPLPYEFVVLNSSVPNAWALPGGKIALNRGLLTEMDSEAELAAVLGHEIVHAAARHSAQQMSRGVLLQAAVLGTAIMTSDSAYSDLAIGGASIGAQLITQRYGRGAELESDFYGMQYMARAGYDPQGAVDLQKTFLELSEGRETDWLSGLFASHPPSQERVEANIQTAAQLPPGGTIGRDRYQAALAETMELKPAYDAYDEGREALIEENYELAGQKAEEAIALFPGEANFYALRGDARYVAKDFDAAVRGYDDAIRRRDDFFRYHLQRGLAYQQLGRKDAAAADLVRSNELFPTAVAHYALGGIEASRGNTTAAVEHYTAAAGGQGDVGNAARVELMRLELPSSPGKYLRVGCYADSNANLVVAVANPTPVAVRDIRFVVQYRDSAGFVRGREGLIRGPIASGQRGDRNTGIGPFTGGGQCPVQLTSAQIAN